MSIKSLLTAALLAATVHGAHAAPQLLTLSADGDSYSAGLSTQAGSSLVTRTEAGAFRDEFLIKFDGRALINASLETSSELSRWASQGITFTRAGFVGISGADLTFETFTDRGTRFSFGFNADPIEAQGDFLFFVEGIAGRPNERQNAAQAGLNSFSYSGGLNLERVAELPEPGSMVLAGLALAGVLVTRRRQPR